MEELLKKFNDFYNEKKLQVNSDKKCIEKDLKEINFNKDKIQTSKMILFFQVQIFVLGIIRFLNVIK